MTIYPKKINKVPLDNIRVEDYVFHTEETNHQKSFICLASEIIRQRINIKMF